SNVSNFNTYSGPIFLKSNSTIGVGSGSQLTISNVIDDGGNNFLLHKELPGTLVLAHANTYGGGTNVDQGVLQITDRNALGPVNGEITQVRDGAQLQLSGGVNLPATQALVVSGTGVAGTGALMSLLGNNTWSGSITMKSVPGQNPTTTPPNFVAFSAQTATDILTLAGVVGESGGSFGLQKVGAGKV